MQITHLFIKFMYPNPHGFVNLSQRIDAMEEITNVLTLTKIVNKYYERFMDDLGNDDVVELLEKYPNLEELMCCLEDLRNQIDPTEYNELKEKAAA